MYTVKTVEWLRDCTKKMKRFYMILSNGLCLQREALVLDGYIFTIKLLYYNDPMYNLYIREY